MDDEAKVIARSFRTIEILLVAIWLGGAMTMFSQWGWVAAVLYLGQAFLIAMVSMAYGNALRSQYGPGRRKP